MFGDQRRLHLPKTRSWTVSALFQGSIRFIQFGRKVGSRGLLRHSQLAKLRELGNSKVKCLCFVCGDWGGREG